MTASFGCDDRACAPHGQEECRGWDVNEVVFSDAMWPVYHGLMRADFKLFDEYEHTHEGNGPCILRVVVSMTAELPSRTSSIVAVDLTCSRGCSADTQPFEFPIVAYWGSKDRKITEAMVSGWRNFTTGSFQLFMIQGTHLWPLVKEAKSQWLTSIVNHIEQHL